MVERPPTYIILGPGRLSYPHLFTKQSYSKGGPTAEDAQYSATILLPKSIDVNPVWAALQAAAIKKWGKIPAALKYPLLDGDVLYADDSAKFNGYQNTWAIRCTSKDRRPGVVDQRVQPISDPGEIIAGYWVNISVNAFAWEMGRKGISFGISNVQLVRRDQPFVAGIYAANEEFGELPIDPAEVQTQQPQVAPPHPGYPQPQPTPAVQPPAQPGMPASPAQPGMPAPPVQPGYQPQPQPATQQPTIPIDPFGRGEVPF